MLSTDPGIIAVTDPAGEKFDPLAAAYWDNELDHVASLLAADSTREFESDDVAAGKIEKLNDAELESVLAEWL
jgi:hypothetical protein